MSLDFTRRQETFEELLHEMDILAGDVGLLPGGAELCARLHGLRQRTMASFTRMNRAIRTLTSVYSISKLLDTSAGMDAILSYIVEGATDELGFDRAILYLISPDGEKLQCKYLKGFSPEGADRAFRYPYDMAKHDCIETRVAKTGREMRIDDIENDRTLTEVDRKVTAHQGRKGSNLHVPILTEGKVVGVLGVDKQKSAFPITEQDIESLKIFAAHAGIVMENARLHHRNLMRIEQFIMLNDIGNRMRAADSTAKIMMVAIEGLTSLVGASRAVFLEYDKGAKRVRLAAAKGLDSKMRLELANRLKQLHEEWILDESLPRSELCRSISRIGEAFSMVYSSMVSNDADLIGFILLGAVDQTEFTRELIEFLSTTTAITLEKARLMEQVVHEKNKSESIISNYSYGIVTTDCRARALTLNPSARLILRLDNAKAPGGHIGEYFPNGEEIAMLVEANLKHNEETVSREMVLNFPSEGQAIIVVTIRSLILNSGINSGSLIIFEDVTLKRKQKEYLQRLENLAALGKLSAALAHEIRNPITGINVSLDVVCSRLAGVMDRDSKKLMKGALEEVARLEKIVADLVTFARPELGEKQRIHLGGIIDNVVLLFDNQCRRKGIELVVDKKAAQPWIMGVEGGVKQALINLILNAIQAMPEGGKLCVSLDTVRKSQGVVQRIHVSDTGAGVPVQFQDKIFEPFFTTRPAGTGLGLSITQSIMDEHGGELIFEQLSPTGSRFILAFPKIPPANQKKPGSSTRHSDMIGV